jgi:hypothetical protein
MFCDSRLSAMQGLSAIYRLSLTQNPSVCFGEAISGSAMTAVGPQAAIGVLT